MREGGLNSNLSLYYVSLNEAHERRTLYYLPMISSRKSEGSIAYRLCVNRILTLDGLRCGLVACYRLLLVSDS